MLRSVGSAGPVAMSGDQRGLAFAFACGVLDAYRPHLKLLSACTDDWDTLALSFVWQWEDSHCSPSDLVRAVDRVPRAARGSLAAERASNQDLARTNDLAIANEVVASSAESTANRAAALSRAANDCSLFVGWVSVQHALGDGGVVLIDEFADVAFITFNSPDVFPLHCLLLIPSGVFSFRCYLT
jgi:hypothetical protein